MWLCDEFHKFQDLQSHSAHLSLSFCLKHLLTWVIHAFTLKTELKTGLTTMTSKTLNHIHSSYYLIHICISSENRVPLQFEICPLSVSLIITSLTSKQPILIKALVQGKTTFHSQQSDGLDEFTWNRQHFSTLWSPRYSLDVNHQVNLLLFSKHLVQYIHRIKLWVICVAFISVCRNLINHWIISFNNLIARRYLHMS